MTDPKIIVSQTPRRPAGFCDRYGENEWEPVYGKPFERCLVCARDGVCKERFMARGRRGESFSPLTGASL